MKCGKSSGSDSLLNEFYIHGATTLIPYLNKLFNTVFENEYFPTAWSTGDIVPLHKKGSISNVENYRGITLLSTLGKLFTRILNNRLSDWAESYNVYVEAQAGFRSGMGTVDNIFVIHGLITHMLKCLTIIYICAFVIFRKALIYCGA